MNPTPHARRRRVTREAYVGDAEITLRELSRDAFKSDHHLGRDRGAHAADETIHRREPQRGARLVQAALHLPRRELRLGLKPRAHLRAGVVWQARSADAARGMRGRVIHRHHRRLQCNPLHGGPRDPELMGDLPGRLPGLYQRLHGVTSEHAEHSPAPPKETGPVLRERRYHETIWLSLRQNLEKNRDRI